MGFYYAIEPIKRNTYWSDGNMNLSCFAGAFDPKNWETSLERNIEKLFKSAKPSCHLVVKHGVNADEVLSELKNGKTIGNLVDVVTTNS